MGGCLPEVRQVGSHPLTHQGPHFQSAAAMLENLAQVGFVEKPRPEHLEPLGTDPAFTDEINHRT